MLEVRTTAEFEKWLDGLQDRTAIQKIQARLRNMSDGNFGNYRSVGGGVSETKIDYGPGYRLYYTRRQAIIVLWGGDKGSQSRDIKRAQKMVPLLED